MERLRRPSLTVRATPAKMACGTTVPGSPMGWVDAAPEPQHLEVRDA
jgi:hypothetical protein